MKAPVMTSVTNVRDLVEHIVMVSMAHFAGTKYEDNWWFIHDALSPMTADETTYWMKRKGYYQRWVLPQWSLNSHLKYYSPTFNLLAITLVACRGIIPSTKTVTTWRFDMWLQPFFFPKMTRANSA